MNKHAYKYITQTRSKLCIIIFHNLFLIMRENFGIELIWWKKLGIHLGSENFQA